MATTPIAVIKQAAADLGLYFSLGSASGTNPYTVNGVKQVAANDERFRWAYLASTADISDWQLVSATSVSGGTITTQANMTSNAAFSAFFVLSPSDWLDATNAALVRLFYHDLATVTLVSGQTEYNVSSAATWLTRKAQVIRSRWRDTATSGAPIEAEVPAVYYREDDEVVTAQVVSGLPADIANTTLIIEGRHYHAGGLTAYTTSVPFPLALMIPEVKWEALKKVFVRLGPDAKRNFGQAMVLAEKDVAEAEGRFLDRTVRRDWSDEIDPRAGEQDQVAWGW